MHLCTVAGPENLLQQCTSTTHTHTERLAKNLCAANSQAGQRLNLYDLQQAILSPVREQVRCI